MLDTELVRLKFELESIIPDFFEHALYRSTASDRMTPDDMEAVAVIISPDKTLPLILDDPHYKEHTPITEVRREVWYSFNALSAPNMDDCFFHESAMGRVDVFAVEIRGIIVAQAWTIRQISEAAEVAVEVMSDYRRKGYAKQCVASWVQWQFRQGRVPIYAHREGNVGSQALANSLGAEEFCKIISWHY